MTKANFLGFLILLYMDDIFIFKHLCLCQQIFSLKLVLRNRPFSPRILLCSLLQHNQLNLISALFNTWKAPFTEFFRKHRRNRDFSAAPSELGETVTELGLKCNGTQMSLMVWKTSLKLYQELPAFSIEPISSHLGSLHPHPMVLSPKSQTGAILVLLDGVLWNNPYIEPDPEHGFQFVVQGCCCVIQVV